MALVTRGFCIYKALTMNKITLAANKVYVNGQTDGMKVYKRETKKGISFTFAANSKDARLHFKTGLTATYEQVQKHLKAL